MRYKHTFVQLLIQNCESYTGIDAVLTSDTKTMGVKAEITEEKIAEDVELVDEPVVENGGMLFGRSTVLL